MWSKYLAVPLAVLSLASAGPIDDIKASISDISERAVSRYALVVLFAAPACGVAGTFNDGITSTVNTPAIGQCISSPSSSFLGPRSAQFFKFGAPAAVGKCRLYTYSDSSCKNKLSGNASGQGDDSCVNAGGLLSLLDTIESYKVVCS